MEQNEQPVFGIEKLYVKDLSVEVPHAPEIFLEREAPQIEIQLGTSGRAIGEGVYEVVLTVTVTAKMQEKAVFLVEIGQGAAFAGTGGSPAPDRSHDSIRCEYVAPGHCSPCPDRRRRCGAGP